MLNLLFTIPKSNNICMSCGNNFSIFRKFHGTWNCRKIKFFNFLTTTSVPYSQSFVISTSY